MYHSLCISIYLSTRYLPPAYHLLPPDRLTNNIYTCPVSYTALTTIAITAAAAAAAIATASTLPLRYAASYHQPAPRGSQNEPPGFDCYLGCCSRIPFPRNIALLCLYCRPGPLLLSSLGCCRLRPPAALVPQRLPPPPPLLLALAQSASCSKKCATTHRYDLETHSPLSPGIHGRALSRTN